MQPDAIFSVFRYSFLVTWTHFERGPTGGGGRDRCLRCANGLGLTLTPLCVCVCVCVLTRARA